MDIKSKTFSLKAPIPTTSSEYNHNKTVHNKLVHVFWGIVTYSTFCKTIQLTGGNPRNNNAWPILIYDGESDGEIMINVLL